MRPSKLIHIALLLVITSAFAQSRSDFNEPREVKATIRKLNPPDRHAILHELQIPASELRGEEVVLGTDHVFFVQAMTGSSYCGASGNCSFWIFDANDRLLLKTIAQQASYISGSHNGRLDVLTRMHGSAFESKETRWQFDGKRYRRAACTDVNFDDGQDNILKTPRIKPLPCR